MDDYKRTLYMIALRDLQELQKNMGSASMWLCVRLAVILRNEHQASADACIGSIGDLVQEFFPEFLELFDGSYWANKTFDYQAAPAVAAAWWPKDWLEPRIRALECLLRD